MIAWMLWVAAQAAAGPVAKLLPSAHAVDREYRVIDALSRQGFPVAKAYALCTDDGVIGSAFYIMSMEEGRVFWDPTLPSQTPEDRRKIFTSKIETLARLHTYDPQAIGLGGASAGAGTGPTTLWVAAYTVMPTPSSAGTEVTGGAYARVAVTSSLANWAGTQGAGTTTASSGSSNLTSNNNAVTFPTPSGSNYSGPIVGFAICDAVSGGNIVAFGTQTPNKTVNSDSV